MAASLVSHQETYRAGTHFPFTKGIQGCSTDYQQVAQNDTSTPCRIKSPMRQFYPVFGFRGNVTTFSESWGCVVDASDFENYEAPEIILLRSAPGSLDASLPFSRKSQDAKTRSPSVPAGPGFQRRGMWSRRADMPCPTERDR